MRFLADMGVSQSTAQWLRDRGYDVIHLRDAGLQKLPDEKIVEKAVLENRIILTFDLDFSDIMASSSASYPSVIIFRMKSAIPQNVNQKLESILSESSEALQEGALISAGERSHRVRYLPIK